MPSSITALKHCPLEFSLGYECEREHLLNPVENLVLKGGHHRLLPFLVLYFTAENGQWLLCFCTPLSSMQLLTAAHFFPVWFNWFMGTCSLPSSPPPVAPQRLVPHTRKMLKKLEGDYWNYAIRKRESVFSYFLPTYNEKKLCWY